MNQAQGAIDAARAAGADQYAAAELTAAADALKRSEDAVAQNDYRLALNHALESRQRAQTAVKAAVLARSNARGEAERQVAEANALLTQLRARLTAASAPRQPRRSLQEARAVADAAADGMQEARAALAADDYPKATRAVDGLAAQIQAALQRLDEPDAPPGNRRRRR